MTDTNTLAPCPFCGERAETDFIPEHHSYQIECSDSIGCTARITRDSELGAIEAWNCRAALAAPSQAATAKQSPHPEYDKGFSDGWNRCEARQAAAPAQAGEWSLGDIDGNWRDIAHKDHGGVMRIVWKMEGDTHSPGCEDRAHSVVAALNAARGVAQAAPVDAAAQQDAERRERERICAAIKAEDDYCVEHGDYMLDSDDCIKIVRGEWKRPDFAIAARAAERQP